ncbi:MAG: SDR family NAD(P)-dependent oxidoreductase [Candidatus Binatia bacterium]|nr:SDR family NAD(P)-dependent oxidoreductase [Candidatus Binatia bacterium]
MNRLDFKGRTALITGGSAGIGYAVAARLLASGARVMIWARKSLQLAETVKNLKLTGCEWNPIEEVFGDRIDVRDSLMVAVGASRVLRQFGRIDVLINNAGEFGPSKPTCSYSLAEWEAVFLSCLTSQFIVCREILPRMVTSGYGRVVNLSSIAGKEGNPNSAAYSAAKAGVIGLTKSLGKEYAKTGVLINCVAPALARTALFNGVPEANMKTMIDKIPMGRAVKVEEIASLICWLASEDCSCSTGAVFDVSGGRATY